MGKVYLNTMTGNEFKQFIEGRNPDKQIDTVPEMMDAMKGISDDETVQQDVNEQIDDKLQQNMGTKADIDEIFADKTNPSDSSDSGSSDSGDDGGGGDMPEE